MMHLLLPLNLLGAGLSGPSRRMTPDEVLDQLQAGDRRFMEGCCQHPHSDADRLRQAGAENQGDHAIATVIACSDSRVPVELIFDTGIMDVFVVRVAGNVCNADEIASIEYGILHVHTPVMVLLGHTQCGAVTATVSRYEGAGGPLEVNIPPLLDSILPAVLAAKEKHPGLSGDALVAAATEENIWRGIEQLLLKSPAIRQQLRDGKVKIIGAIYDVGTGNIDWLSELKTIEILNRVETDPARTIEAMAP